MARVSFLQEMSEFYWNRLDLVAVKIKSVKQSRPRLADLAKKKKQFREMMCTAESGGKTDKGPQTDYQRCASISQSIDD